MLIRTVEEIKRLPNDSVIAAINNNNQLISVAMKQGPYWHLPALIEPKTAEEIFTATENGMSLHLLYPRRYRDEEVEKVARSLYGKADPRHGQSLTDLARAVLNTLEGKEVTD